MPTTAAPDGVVFEVAIPAADSPSQERLGRIAALLRDAELAGPVALPRGGRARGTRRTPRVRGAA
jgi:hypothetical protein